MKKKKAKQREKHANAKEQLVYNREAQVALKQHCMTPWDDALCLTNERTLSGWVILLLLAETVTLSVCVSVCELAQSSQNRETTHNGVWKNQILLNSIKV